MEDLKKKSIEHAIFAYEEYRAACKLADNSKQLKSQIRLLRYMALSLYICDEIVETQLYAFAAINLVLLNTTNATEQDLYDAKTIFDKVKGVNPSGRENTQSDTEIVLINNSYNALVKTETLVNQFTVLEKNGIHRSINEKTEKIFSELIFKADRKLVRWLTNKEEILQAKRHAAKHKRA